MDQRRTWTAEPQRVGSRAVAVIRRVAAHEHHGFCDRMSTDREVCSVSHSRCETHVSLRYRRACSPTLDRCPVPPPASESAAAAGRYGTRCPRARGNCPSPSARRSPVRRARAWWSMASRQVAQRPTAPESAGHRHRYGSGLHMALTAGQPLCDPGALSHGVTDARLTGCRDLNQARRTDDDPHARGAEGERRRPSLNRPRAGALFSRSALTAVADRRQSSIK